MLNFLTPELFDTLVWVIIGIGGVWALGRLVQDLTGPPRWPRENRLPPPSSGPPGPEHDHTPEHHRR